jgi:hypothetical protein
MRKLLLVSLCALVVAVGGSAPAAKKKPTGIRESKFFKVDMDHSKVVGPIDRVKAALSLDLTSVTTDQPQYWPNEKVYLKVMALGRPSAEVSGKLAKRDGISQDVKGKLDENGLLVVEVLDGTTKRLELGEYRLDVAVQGGKGKGQATFSVVEGTLGSLSFAHEWKKVTKPDELERVNGAWFLGNAAGAGKRWGNGLSFKNELRMSNRAFSGEVTVNSRCMLPGCNGTHAGPPQKLMVEQGQLLGTLNVGGHSGPFQIEVISPRGSLRHQFEGSSHVERDMVAAAGGVSFDHKVGVAPYENTVQVPGRDLFVESKKQGADPFVVSSLIAQSGKLNIEVTAKVNAAALFVHTPNPDGSFASKQVPLSGDLAPGRKLEVEVPGPYALVTIGGFVGDTFKEGWALGFPPSQLKVSVSAAAEGQPKGTVPVTIQAESLGKGVALSAILEVYDNRVPSRSPATHLNSAVGDSLRNASRSVSSWSDNTGWIEDEVDARMDRDDYEERSEKKKEYAPAKAMRSMSYGAAASAAPSAPPPPPGGIGGLGLSGRGSGGGGMGYGAKMGKKNGGGGGGGGGARGGQGGEEDDGPKEEVREGDKKVVFCQRIVTDSSGRALVEVTLPPQTGRVVMRVVAAQKLEFAHSQRELDVKRVAGAEARLPRSFVPGAELRVPIDLMNSTQSTLRLSVTGPGIAKEFQVPPGQSTQELDVKLGKPGMLSLTMQGPAGKVYDRREVALSTIAEQQVTFSRLQFGDGGKLTVGADETARVYAGAGPLLRGMAMNVYTTSESWFGHAEALSARVAVRAALLAAVKRGLLDDDGLAHTLRTSVDKDVRDLDEAFCDKGEGLCRPYPGLPTSPLWSGWVARNLLSSVRSLQVAASPDPRVQQAQRTAQALADRIRQALTARGQKTEQLGGFDASGQDVLPVEVNGQVIYRVITDDAVTRWASEKLLPKLDLDGKDTEVAFAKAYDAFRFLRAFERVGATQYLTELAMAFYQKGDKATFAKLYRQVTRNMILAQEPGLIQGPALLGGVYSTPMALVRFVELQLLIGASGPSAQGLRKADGSALGFEETVKGPATIELPAGTIARLDRPQLLRLTATTQPFATAKVSRSQARVGEELSLEVELAADRDPLEYYALIAVPTTTSVKQTEDILSDYRGQLLYGQQGQGGTQMQLLTVPFRGKRSLRLLLEGAYKGHSAGLVMIRHIESLNHVCGVAVPDVSVQ